MQFSFPTRPDASISAASEFNDRPDRKKAPKTSVLPLLLGTISCVFTRGSCRRSISRLARSPGSFVRTRCKRDDASRYSCQARPKSLPGGKIVSHDILCRQRVSSILFSHRSDAGGRIDRRALDNWGINRDARTERALRNNPWNFPEMLQVSFIILKINKKENGLIPFHIAVVV